MQSLGQVQVVQPFGAEGTPTFQGKVLKEQDINQGWQTYDNLKNWEYNVLAENNWTTNSAQYSAWKEAYFNPKVIAMEASNPAWYAQFAGGGDVTSSIGLTAATAPLRTLLTWEVIPQHGDFENQNTVAWRNVLTLAQQAGNAIEGLKLTGGSQAEQDLVMTSLQGQLQAIAQAAGPQFAAQLAQFTFSKYEDLVNLEADEELAQADVGGSPQIQTVGGGTQPIQTPSTPQ
jgi:hypothetical protein